MGLCRRRLRRLGGAVPIIVAINKCDREGVESAVCQDKFT